MKNITKKLSNKAFTNVVAVVTALSLVFLQVPVTGWSSKAMADSSEAAQEQLAENTAIDIPLAFEHAYITYEGQTIASPATKVTLPAGSAMEFAAVADNGYQLESVKATIDGVEVELSADESGVYKLTASDVAVTSEIAVRGVVEPSVEAVVVAVEDDASASGAAADKAETVENDAADKSGAAASPASEDKSAASADKSSASADKEAAASSEAASKADEPVEGEAADATAAVEAPVNTQNVFTYSDDDVTVTAVLSRADAIPANAVFRVKPVTASTSGYNYDVYMDALNASSDEIEYSSENTLLYDVAFMVPKVDNAGNVIEGEFVEFQPEAGTVAISIQFNKNQLSGELEADDLSDIQITHLPLKEDVRGAVDSTENATNIYTSDVYVENVQIPEASVSNETVSFVVDNLSVIGVTKKDGSHTTVNTMTDYSLHNILSNYTMFVSGDVNNANHMVGPVAVGGDVTQMNTIGTGTAMSRYGQSVFIKGEAHTGNIMTSGQPVYLGTVNQGQHWYYYTESADAPLYYTNDYIDFDAAFASIESQIRSLESSIQWEDGNAHLDYSPWALNDGGPIINFEAGHNYKVTDVNSFYKWNSNRINNAATATADTIILIEASGTVTLGQISTGLATAEVGNGASITFLIPNATEVNLPQTDWFGHVVAPNATISQTGGNFNGCLVGKEIEVVGEGHLWGYNGTIFTPAVSGLKVAKELVDQNGDAVDFENRAFQFKLTALDGAPMPNGSNGAEKTITASSTDPVGFGDITFDYQQGRSNDTFTYMISEVKDNQAGITYDETVYYVTASVTYSSDGTTSVQWTCYTEGQNPQAYPSGGVVFKNTKKDDSAEIELVANKVFTNGDLSKRGFAFQLKDEAGVVKGTAWCDANGSVKFPKITFDNVGEYKYTINEIVDEAAEQEGVTYDKNVKNVTVNVSRNNGKLVAAATYAGGSATFTNTYSAEGSINLEAYKTVNGQAPTANDPTFTFTLKGNGIADQSKDAGSDGKVSFDTIEYTAAGTYTYTISEVIPAGAKDNGNGTFTKDGYTYDATPHTVVVVVTDDGKGHLNAVVDQTRSSLSINNTYQATGSVELQAYKKYDGADLTDGLFSAKLYAVDGNGQRTFVQAKDFLKDAAGNHDGALTFDAITYNGEGTFHYVIVETYPNIQAVDGVIKQAGITYDTHEVAVTVEVVDDHAGNLVATPKYDNGAAPYTFTNSYDAQTSLQLQVTKVLENKPLKANDFEFDLLDAAGHVLQTKKNDASGIVAFDAIEYTQEGTYNYTIRENKPTDAQGNQLSVKDGVTYTDHVATVSVKVTDNHDGTMSAVATYGATDDTKPVFTNIYDAHASITLTGSKTMEGRSFKDGDTFSFTMSATSSDSQKAPKMPANNPVVINPTSGTTAELAFGEITYGLEDVGATYTYTVTEQSTIAGVTKDAGKHTFTVTVTDNGDGTLNAAVSSNAAQALAFKNTYNATGDIVISGTKTLVGANIANYAGQFRFQLKDATGKALQTVANDAQGAFAFNKIDYKLSDLTDTDANGNPCADFTYTVTELNDGVAGVTYDQQAVKTVNVHVVDKGTGTLEVTAVENSAPVSFTNTYSAEGKAKLSAKKELSGRDLKAGEFSFELSGAGIETQTVAADSNGNVAFGEIAYSLEDLKDTDANGNPCADFTYTIREVVPADADTTNGAPEKNGVKFTTEVKTVTVHVVDNGSGALVVTYGDNHAASFAPVKFENEYDAKGSAELHASKSLVGKDLEAGVFEFKLFDASGKQVGESAYANASGNVAFGKLEYKLSDLTKKDAETGLAYDVFTYTVKEVIPDGAKDNGDGTFTKGGYTYDGHAETVTVTVADNGLGALLTSVSHDADGVAFKNKYKAEGHVDLEAAKTLNGSSNVDRPFSFELARVEGDSSTVLQTKDAAENGAIKFDTIDYTEADAGKTYTYTIKEVIPEGATVNANGVIAKDGYTYDGHQVNVTVTIADNGDGTLEVTKDYGDSNTTFANTYEATGEAPISVTKSLNGEAPAAGKFTFELYANSKTGQPLQTKVNNDRGLVEFDPIQYTLEDAGKTFTYVVCEVIPDGAKDNGDGTFTKDGYTYDGHQAVVTVSVVDNNNGELIATTTYKTGSTAFANTYDADGFTTVTGQKSLVGRPFMSGDTFTFTVEAEGENAASAPLPEHPVVTINPTSGNNVALDFGKISYGLADAGKTYQYKVVESGTVAGVQNDTRAHTFTVTVTDEGNGRLKVGRTYSDGDKLVFENTYNAEGSAVVDVTKQLKGTRGLNAGEFEFTLKRADDNSPNTAGLFPQTKTNDASGLVKFDAIPYKLSDLKKVNEETGLAYDEFTYTVTETQGTMKGVTYDTAPRTVLVRVSDNGKGELETSVSFDNNSSSVFVNEYDAEGKIVLKGVKNIENREFNANDTVTFTLSSADSAAPMPKPAAVTISPDEGYSSTFEFPEITYTSANAGKQYTYTITEQANMAGVTNDPVSTRTVVVTVGADDGNGVLPVSADYGNEGVKYTNTYDTSGAAQIVAHKDLALTGLSSNASLTNRAFKFQLVDADGKEIQAKDSDVSGNVAFDAIDYGRTDAGKTFSYIVREVVPEDAILNPTTGKYELNGVEYSAADVPVTVTVDPDDFSGTLQTHVAYAASKEGVTGAPFTNAYDAHGEAVISGTKELSGRTLADGQFTFLLKDKNGETVGFATNDADGNFAFEPLEYNLTDAGQTYEYTVSEQLAAGLPDASGSYTLAGYTYDSHVANVTVTVSEDNGTGKLSTTVSSSAGDLTFKNSYEAQGSVVLQAAKELVGHDMANGQFTFRLVELPSYQADVPLSDLLAMNALQEKVNTGNGVTFDEITYTDAGQHSYAIYEVNKAADGYTYDTHVLYVDVVVTDNGNGTLDAVETYKGTDAAKFSNGYDANGALTFAGVKTIDTRDFQEGDAFTFTVTSDDVTAPLPNPAAVTVRPTQGKSVDIPFGEIKYALKDAGKTYVYTVTESANVGGVSVDTRAHKVSVAVTDNGNGTLMAVPTYSIDGAELAAAQAFAFDNKYTAEGSFELGGTKNLVGRNFHEGDAFTFNVTADDANAPMPERSEVTISPVSGQSEPFSFGAIGYTLDDVGKTYTYTITETATISDVKNDVATHRVAVSIADNLDGSLAITPVYSVETPADEGAGTTSSVESAEALVFTNTYQATGSVSFFAKKMIDTEEAGLNVTRTLKAGEFEFELVDADGKVLQTKKNNADGFAEFDSITYTLSDLGEDGVAEFKYTIREKAGDKGGFTYDNTEYKFTVTVSEKEIKDGQLNVVVGEGYDQANGAQFSNKYKAEGETFIEATKYLGEITAPEGAYKFNLVDKSDPDHVYATASNDADGKIKFKVTAPAADRYSFIMSEVVEPGAKQLGQVMVKDGVAYDSSEIEINIEAFDQGDGTLKFETKYDGVKVEDGGSASFINSTVDDTFFDLGVNKTISGRPFNANDSLTFTLTATSSEENVAAPLPKDAQGNDVTSVTIGGNLSGYDATAQFGRITYTTNDLGNTYTYYVAEQGAGTTVDGVKYDPFAHWVKVKVIDDSGKLGVETTYQKAESADAEAVATDGLSFTNEYTAKGQVTLEASKVLNGRALRDNEFAFKLALVDGEQSTYLQTKQAKADGKVEFNPITYTEADAGKTYHYTITEVEGPLADEGVTYDLTPRDVYVTVTDNGDGTLSAVPDYAATNTLPTITNEYKPSSTTAHIDVTKVLDGREWGNADSFTFKLTAKDNAPAPASDTVTITEANQIASFGDIKFDTVGDYVYTVSEEAGPLADKGVTYDATSHDVTIKVSDLDSNGLETGKLSATVVYDDEELGAVQFTNKYEAQSTTANLAVTKVLTGREWGDAESFSFTLSAVDNAPMPEADTVTVTNGSANHTEQFLPITYLKAGEYKYLIQENVPEGVTAANPVLNGIAYDLAAHPVTVKVTDNLEGQLVAEVVYEDADATASVFTNKYSTTDVPVVFEATKDLKGEALAAGKFSFELKGTSANAADVKKVAANTADGKVVFEPITYSATGTYTYEITEVIPAEAVTAEDGTIIYDGFSYDATVHQVTVTVTDNNLGALEAEVVYADNAAPVFKNAKVASTQFEFNKYLFGGVGTFNFKMTAVDEKGVARTGQAAGDSAASFIVDNGKNAIERTVKNGTMTDGVGKITFPEIVFLADGDYYYLIEEAESGNASMTIDEAQYLAHVVVKDGVANTTFDILYDGENYGATEDLSFYNNMTVKMGFNSLSAQSYNGPEQRVSVYPKAKKYLNERSDQLVGGEFSFELIDGSTGKTIAMAANDELGNIAFFDENTDPGLAYNEPGEWTYYIREIAGNEAGMIYDDNVIMLTVKVEQTEDGLAATTIYNNPDGVEPAFHNSKEAMDITVQKVSRYGGEGLVDCTYALWMVGPKGDALIQEAVSDENGYITFKDVTLLSGQKYYFKEVAAPKGHTVDPYRTAYFTLNATGDGLVLIEETAADGWHSATENIVADKAKSSEANE